MSWSGALSDEWPGLSFVSHGLNILYIICTNSDRTSQAAHYVSATNPNRLMLFRETVAVYCENHTEHTNTVRISEKTHYVSATKPN
jgi:hypothetical protein